MLEALKEPHMGSKPRLVGFLLEKTGRVCAIVLYRGTPRGLYLRYRCEFSPVCCVFEEPVTVERTSSGRHVHNAHINVRIELLCDGDRPHRSAYIASPRARARRGHPKELLTPRNAFLNNFNRMERGEHEEEAWNGGEVVEKRRGCSGETR